MRSTLIRGGVASFAGVFAVGFLATVPSVSTASSEVAVTKRDEQVTLLETVEDGDDDDLLLDRVRLVASRDSLSRASVSRVSRASRPSRETRASRASRPSRDKTNSRTTRVSRDRDRSRGDLTRDWTRDGGDRTLDRTADSTNDRSRHDTRGRR